MLCQACSTCSQSENTDKDKTWHYCLTLLAFMRVNLESAFKVTQNIYGMCIARRKHTCTCTCIPPEAAHFQELSRVLLCCVVLCCFVCCLLCSSCNNSVWCLVSLQMQNILNVHVCTCIYVCTLHVVHVHVHVYIFVHVHVDVVSCMYIRISPWLCHVGVVWRELS